MLEDRESSEMIREGSGSPLRVLWEFADVEVPIDIYAPPSIRVSPFEDPPATKKDPPGGCHGHKVPTIRSSSIG